MKIFPLLVLVLVVVGLLAASFAFSRNATDREVVSRVVPGIGGGPDDLADPVPISSNPGGYLGRQITVEGEIERVLVDDVLAIKQKGFEDSEELFIIPTTPPQENPSVTFQPAQQVMVTGTVRVLNNYEIEVETGRKISDPNENLMTPKTVLLATDIMILQPTEVEAAR